MSKRSPFWQSFSVTTPLGYAVEGHFHTEPGPNFGMLRVTRVDEVLPKPYLSPGLPEPVYLSSRHATAAWPLAGEKNGLYSHDGDSTPHEAISMTAPKAVSWSHADAARAMAAANDARLVERLDGTLVAFWPLYDAHGALVEVVPRTRDLPVAADTSWRPLASLVRAARHAGIEEAVRRQRAVFVFTLAGYDNARVVGYPYAGRLILHSVLRGSGRTLGTFKQVQGWARQYGLDVPDTRLEFDTSLNAGALESRLTEALATIETTSQTPIGQGIGAGAVLWVSMRQGACMLDALPENTVGGEMAIALYDVLARIADRDGVPSLDEARKELARWRGEAPRPELLEPYWRRWAVAYPNAYPARPAERIAV